MKHIGIYGGTFDPIHEGHVLFAQVAAEQFAMDLVVFLPEPAPRRKSHVYSDLQTRVDMIKAATQHNDLFDVFVPTDAEAHTPANTMPAIREMYGVDADFTLLLGGDVFEHVPYWDDFETFSQEVGFVVGLRTEDDGEIVIPLAARLGVDADFIQSPLAGLSSKKIRQNILEGRQPKGLADEVAHYISEHKLYTEPSVVSEDS